MQSGLKRALVVIGFFALAACAGYVAQLAYPLNQSWRFYLALLVTTGLMTITIKVAGFRGPPLMVARALLLFSVFLPAADLIYVWAMASDRSPAKVKPIYSFRDAKGDPKAFHAWFSYYADQWKEGRKYIAAEPDPKGILPFVLVRNSRGPFFESEMHINNQGFRGDDFAAEKGDRYRIFALGESPTFGGTIHHDDLPWPDVLQELVDRKFKCDRPIQVINAGTAAYSLKENVERLRRDIIPLEPDIVVSYHGFLALGAMNVDSAGPSVPERGARASALLGEAEYRLRQFQFRALQDEQAEQILRAPLDQILKSPHADWYRELIALGRNHHFKTVLANSSMAVTAESPNEVKEFYDGYWTNVRAQVALTSVHNRMVKEIAVREGIPFIDTTPGFAGNWDSDLFLDPVHFTQKGSNLFAEKIFEGLRPLLLSDTGIRCREK